MNNYLITLEENCDDLNNTYDGCASVMKLHFCDKQLNLDSPIHYIPLPVNANKDLFLPCEQKIPHQIPLLL